MATKPYYTTDGVRVPSVTTIISCFRDPGALMYWSASQTAEYVIKKLPESPTKAEILQLCDQARTAYRDIRDAAADAGTQAHGAAERHVKGLPPEPFVGPNAEKASRSFGAFLEWSEQTKLRVTHTELSLVSDRHKFGGTMDGATFHNKRGLLDYKTSNAIHAEYLIQLGGYDILWHEHFPLDPVTGGYYLCRFDRESGGFSTFWWEEIEAGKRSFLLMRELYELSKTLKQRAK